MGDRTAGRTIQSVDRAIKILNVIADEPQGLGLGKIADAMDLPPQTVQSLLRTLEAHALVTQNGRGEPYMPGPGLHRLARKWEQGRDLGALARPAVLELSKKLGEYVLFAQLRGNALVALVEVSPERSLMVATEMDASGRLHTMATGKLLLAFLDDEHRKRVISSLQMTKRGPHSVTNIPRLKRQLKKILMHDYVVCLEEAGAGVAALAVPVRDEAGNVIAALGTALPLARYDQDDKEELLNTLKAAALQVQARGA